MRLHELHINNFKFFQKQDKSSPLLKIEGKNLLIYGENGSGKSTIYWAIYTLLESAFKTKNEDVAKYFIRRGDYSLVNIYANTRHNSHIKMVLKEESGNANEFYLDGERETIERIRANANVKESNMASDFLNYRILFSLHNAKHSKGINLFQWFEEQIFPYIKVKEIDINRSVKEVFEDLKNGPEKVRSFGGINEDIFPNPSMKDDEREAVKKDYKKYQTYQRSVNRWNREIKKYLNQIVKDANEILNLNFKQNLEIELDYHPLKINVTEEHLEVVDNPSIELKIPLYNGKRNVVKKPHTFLNEAKLAAIGLSIRFAVLLDWTNRPNTALLKILVIDDLILSLDMGNRDIVLELLLDCYDEDYQVILMTHDRSFFEFSKRKINNKNLNQEWKFIEMFEDTLSKKPKPYFKPLKSSIQVAEDYFNQHDYPACGIYLRKELEKLLENLLPERYKKKIANDPIEIKKLNLNDLIQNLIPYCKKEGIDYSKFADLKIYKDVMLNPLAHNDLDAPFYRKELKHLIEIIKELSKIKRGRGFHKNGKNMNFTLYKPDSSFYSVRMKPKEPVVLIEEVGKEPRISIFSKCEVSSVSNNEKVEDIKESFDTIKDAYEEMCRRFGITPTNDISRLFDYDGKTFDEKMEEMNK